MDPYMARKPVDIEIVNVNKTSNEENRKAFTINNKLVPAHAHTGTHAELASQLRLSSVLNTTVRN
jgi:hypothetical protein